MWRWPSAAILLAALAGAGEPASAAAPFLAGPVNLDAGTAVPQDVAAGDVNGDGAQDIVVAGGSSDTVAVLLNNGTGGFASAVEYATDTDGGQGSSFPISVAIADLNGAGGPDIVAANDNMANVAVFLNNGSGGFPAVPSSSPATVASQNKSVAAGPIDGDADFDLAVATSSNDSVNILSNNGSGVFAAFTGSPIGVGESPQSVALIDVNAAGGRDLVTANFASRDVSVVPNNGASPPVFGTEATWLSFDPDAQDPDPSPTPLAVGDLDGAGGPDLVVLNLGPSASIGVLKNNGSGGFPDTGRTIFQPGPFEFRDAALGDLDDDDDLDMAIAMYGGDHVELRLNDSTGSFDDFGGAFDTADAPQRVAIADFNGDGLNDVATGNENGVDISILRNAPVASLNATQLAFGDQQVGTTSNALVVSVTNTAAAPLVVSGVNVTGAAGDFAVDASDCTSAPVPADEACQIAVRGAPTATGARNAILRLTDNAPGNPQVALSVTGTPPPAGASPPGGQAAADTDDPGILLALRRVLRLSRRGELSFTAGCDEDCTLAAAGTLSTPNTARTFRLRGATRRLAAGRRARLRLRLARRSLRTVRRALAGRKRVRATIVLRATDRAGNATTVRRRVRIRR